MTTLLARTQAIKAAAKNVKRDKTLVVFILRGVLMSDDGESRLDGVEMMRKSTIEARRARTCNGGVRVSAHDAR